MILRAAARVLAELSDAQLVALVVFTVAAAVVWLLAAIGPRGVR